MVDLLFPNSNRLIAKGQGLHTHTCAQATSPVIQSSRDSRDLLEDDVHTLFLKADCPPRTKAGGIGNLRLADVEGADDGGWDTLRLESLQEEILALVDENRESDCFLEIDRKGCQVIQLGDLRISCTATLRRCKRDNNCTPSSKTITGRLRNSPEINLEIIRPPQRVFICGRRVQERQHSSNR